MSLTQPLVKDLDQFLVKPLVGSSSGILPPAVFVNNTRITQLGDVRVTSTGDIRVTNEVV